MQRISVHIAMITLVVSPVWLPAAEPMARWETIGGQRILHVEGSYREMGKARGKMLREELETIVEAVDKTAAVPLPEKYPDELLGIAEGSEIPVEKLWRADYLATASVVAEAAVVGSGTVGGRAIHAVASAKDVRLIPIVYRPARRFPYLLWTRPTSVTGIAGMNDHGISVSVLSERPQSNIGLVLHYVLGERATLAAAVERAQGAMLQSVASLLIVDGKIPDARMLEAYFGGTELKDESERVPVGTFGPGESFGPKWGGSNLRLFYSLPNTLWRTKLLRQFETVASGTPRGEAFDYWQGLLSAGSQSSVPLTVAGAIRNLRGSPDPGSGLVLSPSDEEFWVGEGGTYQRYKLLDILAGESASKALLIDAADKPIADAGQRMTTGTVTPKSRGADPGIPEMYRLDEASFAFEFEPEKITEGVLRSKVRFASPVVTEHEVNNTVHAEYFRPRGKGPFPCVVVLHITGGDFELCRFMALSLARSGIAALFVKMPYYGERRPKEGKVRMVSSDLERSLNSLRQTVLDLRRTCDWIEAWPEHDGRIGITGVSLGAITGALAASIEPRFTNACLIMGGAKLEYILFDSSERDAGLFKEMWTKAGGTMETFRDKMRPYDPWTYGNRLRDRVVLMVGASEDVTVPKVCGMALWEATGKQKVVWYPCGHYTIAWYFTQVMANMVDHFKKWETKPAYGE